MTNDFINGLELSTRASNVIFSLRVQNLEGFMAITEVDVLRHKNCGRKTWHEIRDLQSHFRNMARGEGDLFRLLALLGDVNHLRRRHPYFHIVITEVGSLQAIDTRPEDQTND